MPHPLKPVRDPEHGWKAPPPEAVDSAISEIEADALKYFREELRARVEAVARSIPVSGPKSNQEILVDVRPAPPYFSVTTREVKP